MNILSALKENEKYLNSIQGRIDQFNNAVQTMWMKWIDSDVVKGIVELATSFVELASNVDLATIALTGFLTYLNISKKSSLDFVSAISDIIKSLKNNVANNVELPVQVKFNYESPNDQQINLNDIFSNFGANAKNEISGKIIDFTDFNAAAGYIDKFNEALDQGQTAFLNYLPTLNDADASLQAYLASLNGGKASLQGYQMFIQQHNAGLEASGIAAKAAAVGHQLLNAAISFGLSLAISAAISGIIKLANAEKEAAEAARDAAKASEELKKQNKSLEDYKDQIKELRTSIDSNTLSESEAYDARKKLLTIQDELISKFGLEKDGINLVTGAIEGQIATIDELSKKNSRQWLYDNQKEINKAIEYFNDPYGGGSPDPERFGGKDSSFVHWGATENVYNMIEEYAKDRDHILAGTGLVGQTIQFTGSAEEVKKEVEDFQAWLFDQNEQIQEDLGRLTSLPLDQQTDDVKKQIESLKKDLEQLQDVQENLGTKNTDWFGEGSTYAANKEVMEQIKYNTALAKYSDQYMAILQAQNDFKEAQAKGNQEDMKKALDALNSATEKAMEDASEGYMDDFFLDLGNQFKAQEFELNIKLNEDGLKDKIQDIISEGGENGLSALDDNQIKDMVNRGLNVEGATDKSGQYTEAQINGLIALQAEADQAGISIESLITILTNLGLIAGRPMEGATESVKSVGKAYSMLATEAEKYRSVVEIINELAYDNIKISEDQYNSLKELIGSEEGFADCVDTTNGYIVTNVDKLNELLKVQKDTVAWNIKLSKSQAELQYHEAIRSISDQIALEGNLANVNMEVVDSLLEQASALRTTINQYQLLENSLLGATNAFTQFSKAQEIDSQNTYGATLVEMAQTMYDAIYKTGEVGSEAFWAAVKATVPDNIYMGLTPGEQQIQAISRYLQENLFSGLTFSGDSFSIDYSSIESFVKKAQSKGLFSGSDATAFDLSPTFKASLKEGENGLKKFAEQLGVTEEYVYAIFSEMDKYNSNGMGLSMLFQLDTSTTSQLTVLNNQLEQALATRKRLLQQGADLSANTAEISYIQSQQAGVKTKATVNTSEYLAIANALENPKKKIEEVLSEDLIKKIKIQDEKGQPVENVFQKISDYLLQLEEPTVLDLEISQDSIQDSMNAIKTAFGDEFEAKFKIFNEGDKQKELTQEEKNALAEYSRLLNMDQLIGDALSKSLTRTETLLDEIATNTGILAGTKEAPKKESETKTESTTTSDNGGTESTTETQQNQKPKINAEAVQYNMAVSKAIDDLMIALANKEVELRNTPSDFGVQNKIDDINALQAKILEIRKNFDNTPEGVIPTADLMAQWSNVAAEAASKYGIEVPLTIKVNKDAISSDISATAQEAKDAVSSVGDTAQETEKELEKLFTVSIPDSEAIKLLQNLTGEELKQAIDPDDAKLLGFNLDEGQIITYGELLDRLIARSQTFTSGLYKVKQAGIETYSALQSQISSYNDLFSQTEEVISNGTKVTEEYKNSLIDLGVDKTELNDCFDVGTGLIVKDTDALKKLVDTAKKNTANNVKLAKSQAQLKYYELYKEMRKVIDGNKKLDSKQLAHVNTLYKEMSAVQSTIAKYSLLEAQLLGVSNAYDRIEGAQQVDSIMDYRDDAENLVNILGNAFNTGELGTEAARVAFEGLIPDSVIDKSKTLDEQMAQAYKYFTKGTISKLFEIEFDKDGNISSVEMTLKKVQSYMKTLTKEGKVFTGTWDEFELNPEIKSIEDLAKALNMTEEMAFAFVTNLEKYDISWLGGDMETLLDQLMGDNLEYQIQKTTEKTARLLQEKASLLGKDSLTKDEQTRLAEINKELDTLGTKMDENQDKAYAMWQAYDGANNAEAALSKLSQTAALTKDQFNQIFAGVDSETMQKFGITWNEDTSVADYLQKVRDMQLALGQPSEVILEFAKAQAEDQIKEILGVGSLDDTVTIKAQFQFDEATGTYTYTGDKDLTAENRQILEGAYGEWTQLGDLLDVPTVEDNVQNINDNAQEIADNTAAIKDAVTGEDNTTEDNSGGENPPPSGGGNNPPTSVQSESDSGNGLLGALVAGGAAIGATVLGALANGATDAATGIANGVTGLITDAVDTATDLLTDGVSNALDGDDNKVKVDVPDDGVQIDTPNDGLPIDVPDDGLPLDVPENGVPLDVPEGGIPLNVPENGLPLDVPDDGLELNVPNDGLPLNTPENGIGLDVPENGVPMDIPENGIPLDIPEGGLKLQVDDGQLDLKVPEGGIQSTQIRTGGGGTTRGGGVGGTASDFGGGTSDGGGAGRNFNESVDVTVQVNDEQLTALKTNLEETDQFEFKPKNVSISTSGIDTAKRRVTGFKSWLDGLNLSKTIKFNISLPSIFGNKKNDGENGDGEVNGTAHVTGTAFATGSWGAPKTETALVGELGPELLVRNGRYTTVGENGAEFTDIRKGDIIFNHKQTESLLSKGYVTGRGKAYAEGTAYAGINTWTDKTGQLGKDYGSGSGSGSSEDDFKEIFDWIAVRIEEITEVVELTSARIENAVGVKNKNSLIDEAIKANQKLYDNLTAGAATYYKYSEQLLAKIPAEYRAAAQDGSIAIEEFLGKVGEETYNAINDYREWVQKGADATKQAEETLTEISALAKQAIDNISAEFENRTSLGNNAISQLEAYNALLETTQGFEAAGIYQAMIKENNKNIQILRQQRNQMQAELNKRVEAGEIKKYSQDWYDAVNSIAEVDTEIINLTKDTNEYQDSVNELHWEQFDALIDRLDAISNESNNLIDILGNKDLVDEDTAEWTDEGITSLGLYAQQLEVAEMQAKKYREEITYLNKNWKKLGYTEQEYAEKLEELKEGQYDAIKAYHDTKKSIVDLTSARVDAIKDGIQKEIDAYEELINKKKEELDSEKDLYDFQKNVKQQQKDIAEIQRKLAALSSDNSASARVQRAKLQAELAEAQANLEDTYYDRSVSDQQDALDKELENFQDTKDKEIEALEEYLEDTEQVVADALATIQSNTDVVYNTLSEMGKEYSLSIADSIVSPWQDGESAIQSYSEKFGLSMSSTVEQLKELEAAFKQTIAEIEKSSVEAVNTVQNNIASYQAAVNQTPARPSQPAGDVIVSGGGSSSSGGSYPYGRASDTSGNIKRGAKGDDVRAIQYALNQLGYGNSGTTSLDGNFGSGTESAVKSFQRAMGIKVDGIVGTNTRAKFRANGYASGTTGTKQNELAWIDEMGLEELVMHAGPNGRLQYLSKGTSVVPADITSNLMEWGALDPQNMLDQNRPVISSPRITNNNIEVNMNFDSVVRVDTVTQDTIPDLTKTINKELDKYMKNLNSQIRKYVR